jgi:hypothetical protein
MRCICCDRKLNDFESTRRHAITNEFLDMCNGCYRSVDNQVALPVFERQDLQHARNFDEGVDNDNNPCYPTFKDYEGSYEEL